MESFPWWTEGHKKLADELRKFVEEVMPTAEEAWWKREFPWDVIKKVAEKRFFGIGIPKEYRGLGLGVTATCIAVEELSRVPTLGLVYTMSMLGGLHQISAFGTEKQKGEFLPKIAEGELGAVCITEPFVGTDAAGIETTARRDGNKYILAGKKRFTNGAGVASRYMVYARTSNEPEDVRQRRHLTGFIVQKGMPGFTLEKINELIGADNMLNGYLDLNEVPVPVFNRIGEEGEGWRIMMSGLNYERTLASAISLGGLREAIRAVVPYMQRRIQFGRPTIDMPTNQFKIANIIARLKLARLATYYTAYLLDLGREVPMESSVCKLFNSDTEVEASLEAIQCMGGDGLTKFYPVERILRQAKIEQITAGTNEATRLVIYRIGLREMAEDLEMPKRTIHYELGVPIHTFRKPEKQSKVSENGLLEMLADDYRVNPGLYMTIEDLRREFKAGDEELNQVLLSLEHKGLVKLYRTRMGIELAKATYEGLRKANPPEYYRWFPSWVKKEDTF